MANGSLIIPMANCSEISNYMDDEKQGVYVSYFENGLASAKGVFDHDLPSGNWISYYDNGKRKEEGNFYHGKKTGIWKSYDTKGKLIMKETFEKNPIISSW